MSYVTHGWAARTLEDMGVVLVIVLVVGWCILPLPFAVAVGRAFSAGADQLERSGSGRH